MNTIRRLVFPRQLCLSPSGNTMQRRFSSISRPEFARVIKKTVKSYGKLLVDLPWNVEVKPIDLHEYPNMDRLVVRILSPNSENLEVEKFVNVDVNEDVCSITAKNAEQFEYSKDARFVVEAPIQYDVDARTSGDSDVSISGMVSGLIGARSERGNIRATGLQGNKIKLSSSEGGSINLEKSAQGDIEMRTKMNGRIDAEKCLGTNLEMRTENGDISLGSNYCERATFSTVDGNLHLDNLHAEANVDISGKGSLNVSCLDGSLRAKVKNGKTRINVVRLVGKSHIISEGPIELALPRENNMQLSLKSNKLSLDENSMGTKECSGKDGLFETRGEIPLYVETPESLRVRASSWAESLRLGKFGNLEKFGKS